MDFSRRSEQKELLDLPGIGRSELYRNLYELHVINSMLGGYRISLNGLEKIRKRKTISVLADIGSGGGDTLRKIENWFSRRNQETRLFGIDLNADCVDYAREKTQAGSRCIFIEDDFRNILRHTDAVDVLHASLFTHHLSKTELVELVRFALSHGMVLLINDLERNAIAYYAIRILTQLFSKSYLVRNDAPLSVRRGFKKIEWADMLQEAGAGDYSVRNCWAFRHQVIVYG